MGEVVAVVAVEEVEVEEEEVEEAGGSSSKIMARQNTLPVI